MYNLTRRVSCNNEMVLYKSFIYLCSIKYNLRLSCSYEVLLRDFLWLMWIVLKSCSKMPLRKRRVFSGKRARRLQTGKRRTMQVEVRRRKTTTTWSSVECVKMEESCCAATPAPLHTTSTALTHPCLKFRTESGSVRVAL